MELLLNSVEPFICLERFFDHLENRRLGVQEILESVVLIWLRPLLLMGMSGILRDEAQCFLNCSLTTQELCKEFIHRRWWQVTVVALLAAACSSTSASHL